MPEPEPSLPMFLHNILPRVKHELIQFWLCTYKKRDTNNLRGSDKPYPVLNKTLAS